MGLGVAKMLIEKGYYVYSTYVGSDFEEKMANFEAVRLTRPVAKRSINSLIT